MSVSSNPSRLISLLVSRLPDEMLFEVFKWCPRSHIPNPLWTIPFFVNLWKQLHIEEVVTYHPIHPFNDPVLKLISNIMDITIYEDGYPTSCVKYYVKRKLVTDPNGSTTLGWNPVCIDSVAEYSLPERGKSTQLGTKTVYRFNTMEKELEQQVIVRKLDVSYKLNKPYSVDADGIQYHYHINGKLRSITHFENGLCHGVSQSWAPNGQLIYKSRYVYDDEVEWQRWDEKGHLIDSSDNYVSEYDDEYGLECPSDYDYE